MRQLQQSDEELYVCTMSTAYDGPSLQACHDIDPAFHRA